MTSLKDFHDQELLYELARRHTARQQGLCETCGQSAPTGGCCTAVRVPGAISEPAYKLSDLYQTVSFQHMEGTWNTETRLSRFQLGMSEEHGEIAKLIRTEQVHGVPIPVEDYIQELGDMLWYVSALASTKGIALSTLMRQNILKLRKRFPVGWNPAAAIAKADRGTGH